MNVWVVTWFNGFTEVYDRNGWSVEDILFRNDKFYDQRLADSGTVVPSSDVNSFTVSGWVIMNTYRVQ